MEETTHGLAFFGWSKDVYKYGRPWLSFTLPPNWSVSMATQEFQIPPNIAQLTGPLLLGCCFNWGLLGALSVQTYYYFITFPDDRRILKSIVIVMFLLELVQTVLATQDAFNVFGSGWGTEAALQSLGLLWLALPIMVPIISSITQLFFAWRIWILSFRQWHFPLIVTLLCVLEIVAGMWGGIYSTKISNLAFLQQHTIRPEMLWLGSTVICDVIVTGGMSYYLTKSKTGFRATDALIHNLMRLIIETGGLSAVLAIIDLCLFAAFQQNNYHLVGNLALSKLYSNNLLVILNHRAYIAEPESIARTGRRPFLTTSYTGTGSASEISPISLPPKAPINVQINREVHTDTYNTRSFVDAPSFDIDRIARSEVVS